MWFRSLFDAFIARSPRTPARQRHLEPRACRRPGSFRPRLDILEDRTLPSTFTVTNLLDTGAGSLRAAVAAANANPGADDINFATTGTIALTSGELDITDSLTINGPGAGALTVSGGGVSRVFGIAGDPTVVIAGLTVANGWTINSPGGGISMTGGTLTLDHVTVSGNYAVGAPGGYDSSYTVYSVGDGVGGGLYVASGTLTLDHSTVSGNYAIGGAGLDDFTAGNGGQGAGAGLDVAGGTVHVNQSTVAGNHALGGAGGNVPSGYFEGQPYAGAGGAAAGGGIRIAAGTVEFYQSTLADNTAVGGDSGSGSWAYSDSPGAGEGGGLSIAGGTLSLDQSTVSGNSAVGGAGAVESTGWNYNLGSYGGRGDGGGLNVAGGTVSVNRTTVSGNQALGGAGGAVVVDLTYSVNGGAAAGGGMRVTAGTVQLSQSTLAGNTADGGSGGFGDPGLDGVGVGGGLSIAPAAPPLADLDTFTESNTINNVADVDPNIAGPYSLNGTSTQPSSFTVSGFPSSTTAGVAGTFTVTARNADGTTATNYRGIVHVTSSDPRAVLPGDYNFTAADLGVHTFTATLTTAGTQALTATDTTSAGITGSERGIIVNPGAASTFLVAGFPAYPTAGVAGSFTVTALDAYDNRATGYPGTVRFTSSDPQAVLPGNYTFTAADAGMHTFSATLKTAGYQSLTATDTVNAALTGLQGNTVKAAAASRLAVSAPTSVSAGVRFSLTVTVKDAYGNVVTGYTGTIHFTSTDTTATLPKNYTFTAADNGVHTFSGLVLRKKGNQTITVTDTLNSSITGSVIENVL
jgi:hypothetical protein